MLSSHPNSLAKLSQSGPSWLETFNFKAEKDKATIFEIFFLVRSLRSFVGSVGGGGGCN